MAQTPFLVSLVFASLKSVPLTVQHRSEHCCSPSVLRLLFHWDKTCCYDFEASDIEISPPSFSKYNTVFL